MKRVLPFLLLNVAVSAATILLVLVLWQAAHRAPEGTPIVSGSQVPTSQLQTSPASYEDASIQIENVIGAGDLDFEVVTLKNTGKDPVDLTGWTLQDGSGNRFVFPAFTVYPDGAFQVFSRSGINTSLELYWGSPSALWQSGSKVLLYDPSGTNRGEYSVP